MGVERVAPGDPVVRVGVLDERRRATPARRSAAATERLLPRFSSPVPQVIVTGIRSISPRPPNTRETKRVMRREARERRTPASRSGAGRSCPTGERARSRAPGCVQCACSQARAPRLAPIPTGRPVYGPKRRQPLADERARIARGGGVGLVPVARRREQRGAERRHLAEGDEVVEQAEQRAVLRVLGPVVDEQERQRLGRVGLGRRPEERGHAEAAREARPPAALRAPTPRRRATRAARTPGTRRRTSARRARPPGAGFAGSGVTCVSPSRPSTASRYSSRSTGGRRRSSSKRPSRRSNSTSRGRTSSCRSATRRSARRGSGSENTTRSTETAGAGASATSLRTWRRRASCDP